MRTALLCVFLTSIIQVDRIGAQGDDFRPTPIPLDEWHHNRRESRTEILHETIQTDSSPSASIVPVHYWEDALRHSVYLTLVRDKIDRLISKEGGKTASHESKEIDDHDLWNKIKTAPFNRLPEEELAAIGDVSVMAKGRLLENKQGFSFVEDERLKENCSDAKCLQSVKAFWSVKRVRQRDHETSQGKYHYELTFSVISQTPKKQKKLHENPIRTFTVRESYPKEIIDRPQEHRKFDAPQIQTRRPERAVWFHKNIAPVKQIGRRQFFQGFDRIFTSLFSDDDARNYDGPPTKYKLSPNGFPPGHQYSKIGHLGVPTDQHQIPYPYRPNQNKQIRPPLSVSPINPIQQTYMDIGQITTANSNLYSLYPYAHRDSNNGIKTTRPAVLPTPLPPITPQRDYAGEVTHPISFENIDNITIVADTMKYQLPSRNKYKPIPVKVNYFPEHVRPPVYNAPPGVFVTMDKKPFKPLPPLKYLHLAKPNRLNRPIDFRPSPQVMDVLFSDPDSFSDTAFKPITVGYEDTNTTNNIELSGSRKKSENKTRKTTLNEKKPLKKHENIKRVSTVAPEIITAQSLTEESIETLDWANILGAFTKTTPMVSQTEQLRIPETTTPMTTTVTTTNPKKRVTTTTEAARQTTTTTAPKKRTRPPPKLVKQEKIKKHKRVTTTTSSTTTTTNAPENIKRRPTHDLTPQASSAATGTTKSFRESHNKTLSSLNSTTTTSTTTTTTTLAPSPTTKKTIVISTTQPKNKNRFRQSTLMLKGTSVKHDRWNTSHKAQSNTTTTPTSSSHRRKGSNFQGYISSNTNRNTDEVREKNHADRKPATASTEGSIAKVTETTSPTQSIYEETVDQYETNSVLPLDLPHEQGDMIIYDEDTNESKDNYDYTSQTSSSIEKKNMEKSPSLNQLSPTPLAQTKNKTKCKKKKHNISTTEEPNDLESDSETLTKPITLVPSTARTAAEISTGNDILDELFNFNFNTDENLNKTSTKNEELNTKSDEFEDFLGVFEGVTKKPGDDNQYDDDYENENDDDESEENYGGDNKLSLDDSTVFGDDGEDEKETDRDSNDDVPPHDRPFSFLELMAMS